MCLLCCPELKVSFLYIYIFYKVSVSIEIVFLKQLVFWKLQLNKFLIQSVKVVFWGICDRSDTYKLSSDVFIDGFA